MKGERGMTWESGSDLGNRYDRVDRTRPDPLREAAERVVDEIKADMNPDRDSSYNMAPDPDPVAALLAFARLIKES